MSLFRLPCGKLAFAQRSGAMKAPVGLLSDRTVLRKQDGGASPRQVTVVLPHCSSRQGWPGRMPVPDVRWLHRDRGKCLWTFSFCSNARSFDRPTVAKSGEKIKAPIFIRRKGADELFRTGNVGFADVVLLCKLLTNACFCGSGRNCVNLTRSAPVLPPGNRTQHSALRFSA